MRRRGTLWVRFVALIGVSVAMLSTGALAQTETTTAFESPSPMAIDGVPFAFWTRTERVIEGSTTSFVAATPSPDEEAARAALSRVVLESPSGDRTPLPWRLSDEVEGEQWFAAQVELAEVGRWHAIGPAGPVAHVEVIGEPVAGSPATTWLWIGGIAVLAGLVVWERIRVGRSKEADELRAATKSHDSWWWG